MRRFHILIISLAAISFNLAAQLNLPIREIGNIEFYYRQVKKKETLYGIAKELGITKETILKYNPSVASGLKNDQWLYFPVTDFLPENKNAASSNHTHSVKKGETLYSISKQYGISIENLVDANPDLKNGLKSDTQIIIPADTEKQDKQTHYIIKKGETLYRVAVNNKVSIESLLKANPGISPSNFRAGDTIIIPEPDNTEQDNAPKTVFIAEKISKGDSFESIATKHNTSAQSLKDANPNTSKLKSGSYIYIPITQETDTVSNEEIISAYNNIHGIEQKDQVSISLILPFESNSENQSQKAILYKNFYGGFLIGLRQFEDSGFKIRLNVYDLADYRIDNIISNADVKNSDIIFISGGDDEIRKVSAFGKKNGINIVNAFDINNDLCYENERFFQLNTPSSYMYTAVQNAINEKFKDYRIVFISTNDELSTDKPLIEYLKSTNLPRTSIGMEEANDLDLFKLAVSDNKKILFVPTQSDNKTLASIKAMLSKLKETSPNYSFSLLGYPEWIAQKSYKPFFHSVDTYIYSRYTMDYDNPEAKSLNRDYKQWYGKNAINAIPNMNIYGYDVATFFINEIRKNNNDFNNPSSAFEGIESCFNLNRVCNWGGFVNTSVFLINYKPNNSTEKTIIR